MKKQWMGMIALATLVGSVRAEKGKSAESKKQGHATKYFNQFDADGDGKLSEAESTEMTRTQLAKNGKTEYEHKALSRFQMHDANGDGFVTREEYERVVDEHKKK